MSSKANWTGTRQRTARLIAKRKAVDTEHLAHMAKPGFNPQKVSSVTGTEPARVSAGSIRRGQITRSNRKAKVTLPTLPWD